MPQEYSHEDLMNMQENAFKQIREMQSCSPGDFNEKKPDKKSGFSNNDDMMLLLALILLFNKDKCNDKLLIYALIYILFF